MRREIFLNNEVRNEAINEAKAVRAMWINRKQRGLDETLCNINIIKQNQAIYRYENCYQLINK